MVGESIFIESATGKVDLPPVSARIEGSGPGVLRVPLICVECPSENFLVVRVTIPVQTPSNSRTWKMGNCPKPAPSAPVTC